jgi:hypothetical protein
MNIGNNFITPNSVQLKQNQQHSKALSFKAETKKDEVNLKSADSEELIKPNKTITRIFSALLPALLVWSGSPKVSFNTIGLAAIAGSAYGEIMIKLSELNERLTKIESKK